MDIFIRVNPNVNEEDLELDGGSNNLHDLIEFYICCKCYLSLLFNAFIVI